MQGLTHNEQYQRGYADALFWVLDKELSLLDPKDDKEVNNI